MATNVPLTAINDEYLMWDLTILDDTLLTSISKHGILAPLACIRFNHEYYVVDGYQRLRIARTLQLKTIYCYDIQPVMPISDVVYQLQQFKLNQSTILRLRYIDHFGIDVTNTIANQLSLPHYSHIRKDIQRICSLDAHIQQFFL